MSQAGIVHAGGGGGGGPLDTLTGDNGIAVPPDGANNINLLTGFGLTSTGNAGTNTITFTQDAANENTVTTVGAVTSTITTIAMGITPGVYAIEARLAAFNTATPAGAGYLLFCAARTDGAVATLIGVTDKTVNEEAALNGCDANITVSGNNLLVSVTGTAGLTVDWKSFSLYTMVI